METSATRIRVAASSATRWSMPLAAAAGEHQVLLGRPTLRPVLAEQPARRGGYHEKRFSRADLVERLPTPGFHTTIPGPPP